MKLFSLKSIAAIAIAVSSFTSFAAHPPLQFQIRGTFDEVVPPCGFSGQSDFHMSFGSISSAMPIGTESQSEFVNIGLQCLSKAKVTLYFSDSPSDISSSVYATTASHMGVKVKLNDQEIKPGEKINMEAQTGNSSYPLKVSLFKLAQVEGGGGNFSFNLSGILETDYM
ncbi:TPA: hypothetical protein U2I51_000411 [Providencia rettgeri]|nr:hypothetical protein [Providencia rettgeri]